jgi:hypothetical protein
MRILFVLLFFVSAGFSDVLPSHMMHGGLLTGAMAKLSGANQTESWVAFGFGAVLGALPDVMGYPGERDSWKTYGRWHDPSTTVSYVPPIRLHLFVDSFYHAENGGWKPGMVPYVILSVIVEGVLIWLFTKWVRR